MMLRAHARGTEMREQAEKQGFNPCASLTPEGRPYGGCRNLP